MGQTFFSSPVGFFIKNGQHHILKKMEKLSHITQEISILEWEKDFAGDDDFFSGNEKLQPRKKIPLGSVFFFNFLLMLT